MYLTEALLYSRDLTLRSDNGDKRIIFPFEEQPIQIANDGKTPVYQLTTDEAISDKWDPCIDGAHDVVARIRAMIESGVRDDNLLREAIEMINIQWTVIKGRAKR